jgi:hypothetical protein
MASTRFSTRQRGAAAHAPSPTPQQALAALARHGVRVHIEAGTAAAKRLAGWAYAAERFVQTAGDELLRLVDGGDRPPDLTTSTRATRVRHSTPGRQR